MYFQKPNLMYAASKGQYSRATSSNKEIPATMVRPRDKNVPKKIDESYLLQPQETAQRTIKCKMA